METETLLDRIQTGSFSYSIDEMIGKEIDDCIIHLRRIKMGGNIGIHSIKQDPPFNMYPNL